MGTPLRHAKLLVVLLLMQGCATPPPPYVPPSVAARAKENMGVDGGTPQDSAQGRASGVRGMNYEELLACGQDKARITALDKKLRASFGAIEARKKAIDNEGGTIEAGRALVDARSQKSVDDFNARIESYHGKVRVLNVDVDTYNAQAKDFTNQARAHGIQCTNRPYRESDRDKLPENLRALMEKDSEPFDLPAVFDDDGARGTQGGS